jgi:hypothetical protein
MKSLFLFIAINFALPFAHADGDWELLNRARHETETAQHSAEEVHNDHAHNCGGHAGKAADLLRKAQHELDEAEKYLKEHPHQKG